MLALALGACGSSSERKDLQNQISKAMLTVWASHDFARCVAKEAGKLPISQERQLAAAFKGRKTPDTAPGQPYSTLAARCIAENRGVSVIRRSFETGAVNEAPAAARRFRRCLLSGFRAQTAAELSAAVAQDGLTDLAGRKLAARIATPCAAQSAVHKELSAVLVAATKRSPAAVRACAMRKAQQVPADLLAQAIKAPPGPASERSTVADVFASVAAKQCARK